MTAWIAVSASFGKFGSLELMGWAGASYQYGILAALVLVGAIPAMLFSHRNDAFITFPKPFGSGYLKLRFGESSRALSAISFAMMTVLMSGINMYSMRW